MRIGTACVGTGLAVDPGAVTPYCQASFSLETLVVLIWVSDEYRRPCASPP